MKTKEDYSIDQNGKVFLIAVIIIISALFIAMVTSAILNPAVTNEEDSGHGDDTSEANEEVVHEENQEAEDINSGSQEEVDASH